MLNRISRIIGPGSPFELVEAPINSTVCRIFRRGPATLNDLYKKSAKSADREFMVCGTSRLTNGQILERAHVLARFLAAAAGAGPGTRVALIGGNSPQWLIGFVAITSLGATAVVVSYRSSVANIGNALDSAECNWIIADGEVARSLPALGSSRMLLQWRAGDDDFAWEPAERARAVSEAVRVSRPDESLEISPDAPALVAFTSGTTGRPKGVVLTHRSMMTGMMNMLLGGALSAARDTAKKPSSPSSPPVSLALAPFSYISGYSNLLLMWYLGGKVVALPSPSVDAAFNELERESVTSLVGVTPTMLHEILRSDRLSAVVASSLRSVNVHGGRMHLTLRQQVIDALPNVTVGTGYGMTETNGSVCTASGAVLTERPLTCGQPLPSVDLQIRREDGSEAARGESGEIFVRGAMLMKEYCNWPAATAEALREGWFKTGDLGRLDEEEYLEVVDRMSGTSEYDGGRISHSEIERVVLDGTLVREALALDIASGPAERSRLVVVVVPEHGQACDSNRIADSLLAAGVTGSVRPEIVTVDALPRMASGKVDNRELREWLLARSAR